VRVRPDASRRTPVAGAVPVPVTITPLVVTLSCEVQVGDHVPEVEGWDEDCEEELPLDG
jgi:hypothetical protein